MLFIGFVTTQGGKKSYFMLDMVFVFFYKNTLDFYLLNNLSCKSHDRASRLSNSSLGHHGSCSKKQLALLAFKWVNFRFKNPCYSSFVGDQKLEV